MPKMVPLRKSFDHHLNDHGKILLEQCKSLDIRILNGRYKGDSFGKITFHGHQGISTVDYILASHELIGIFQNFISCSSTFIFFGSLSTSRLDTPTDSPSDNKQELVTLPRQFKWSLDSKEKFVLALH